MFATEVDWIHGAITNTLVPRGRGVVMVPPCRHVWAEALQVVWPIRLVTLENQREHWASKAKRAKQHRSETLRAMTWAYHWARRRGMLWPAPNETIFTLTRLAPRVLDSGNLEASFKHVQDGIADWFGFDDSELVWRYGQEKCAAYGVRIKLEIANQPPRDPAANSATLSRSAEAKSRMVTRRR